jgi:hypothetical protein
MAIALCKELLLPNSSFNFSSVNNSHFGVFSSRPKNLDLPERRSRNRSETIMLRFAITQYAKYLSNPLQNKLWKQYDDPRIELLRYCNKLLAASSPNFSQASITATLGVCKVFCADAPEVLVGRILLFANSTISFGVVRDR